MELKVPQEDHIPYGKRAIMEHVVGVVNMSL